MDVNFVQEVKTLENGSFYIHPFESCNKVRLTAMKTEDLWLKTGHGDFYGKDNGTAPMVEATRLGSLTSTQIRLGERGARVDLLTTRL